jgi:hypothetical protein
LLSDDIKQKVDEAIIRLKEIAGTNLFYKWLSFGDVGYGVAGLGMVGPGGAEERCVMTLFNKMDVQVTISTPGKTRLEILPGAEAYHDLIYEGGISQKLIDCLNAIASKAADKRVNAVISATPPPEAMPPVLGPSPKRSQRPSVQSARPPHAPSEAASALGARKQSPTFDSLWFALAILVVLAFFIWRVSGHRT